MGDKMYRMTQVRALYRRDSGSVVFTSDVPPPCGRLAGKRRIIDLTKKSDEIRLLCLASGILSG